MNRLLEIGFEKVGYWRLDAGRLALDLHRMSSKQNILYAFVCDGEVKYIGKTKGTLSSRMNGYRSPGVSQTTNLRNHSNIKALLEMGGSMDVLALPDDGLLHYGPFHLNLAAGLEDDLIRVINPEWNGGRVELQSSAPPDIAAPEAAPDKRSGASRSSGVVTPAARAHFDLTLHPTYYHQGFFNVRVAQEELFGGDGEPIEIFVADEEEPLAGMINRTANMNGTPRIMGGRHLRDWFYKAGKEKGQVFVEVMTPNSIRLKAGQ